MDKVQYKGYVIEPRISALQKGGFGAEVHIAAPPGTGVHIKQFYFTNTFSTEHEARDHAILAGRRLIDEGNV